jgi:acetyl esterase/lipase
LSSVLVSIAGLSALLLLGAVSSVPGPVSAADVPADRPAAQPLWPHAAPEAQGDAPEDIPTLTLYRAPADKTTGAAMLICPGGGYGHLADHEGHPVALWLNSLGITAGVLKYRLGPKYHHPAELEDAARGLRTLRARAIELGLDPHRIGVLGFSAGGHLASTLSTHFDSGKPDAADPIDRVSSRPDLSVLIYPVISFTTEYTHVGSRKNLLGDMPSPELMELLSNEKQVTAQTPPAFLVATSEDRTVPMENSLLYALALRKAHVPVELHVYEKGAHGFGLGGKDPVLSTWPERCATWLRLRDFAR